MMINGRSYIRRKFMMINDISYIWWKLMIINGSSYIWKKLMIIGRSYIWRKFFFFHTLKKACLIFRDCTVAPAVSYHTLDTPMSVKLICFLSKFFSWYIIINQWRWFFFVFLAVVNELEGLLKFHYSSLW